MIVIYKTPGKDAEIRNIENSLEALQQAVGGYIETVTFATDATIICNEEGHLLGLPINCEYLGIVFVGPILIVGRDGEEFCDVPEPEIFLEELREKG